VPVDAGCTANHSTDEITPRAAASRQPAPRRSPLDVNAPRTGAPCYDPDVPVMNVKRTVLLGVLCGTLVVWLASAATSRSRAPVVPEMRVPAPPASSEALAAEIERLHERLRPAVEPTESRDLFRYGARPSRRSELPPPTPAIAAPIPLPQPPAPFALIGVAEDAGTNGPVRTAIISGTGDMLFVHEGDTIVGRFRVDHITADAIELTDGNSGAPLRFTLK
jgi:hypothetical protein